MQIYTIAAIKDNDLATQLAIDATTFDLAKDGPTKKALSAYNAIGVRKQQQGSPKDDVERKTKCQDWYDCRQNSFTLQKPSNILQILID